MKLIVRTLLVAFLAIGATAGLSGSEAIAQASASANKDADKKDAPAITSVPFMFGLFDARKPEPVELSEDQLKHEEKMATLSKRKPPKIDDRFKPQKVSFSGYQPGTIVIDTKERFLYFVESPVVAIRYGVAVGKEGLSFTGKVKVGAKQPWPRWTPTKQMIEREPRQYKRYADGMEGGTNNPLGARAIYLYKGRHDTYLRIHGTNKPNTIGSAASNGCFRMVNEHVIDLYDRVKVGAQVVVL